MTRRIRPNRHLNFGAAAVRVRSCGVRRRWLECVGHQQREVTRDSKSRHDPEEGADRRRRIASFDRCESGSRDAHLLSQLTGRQPLSLAKTSQPITQRQKQLALYERVRFSVRVDHMFSILGTNANFVQYSEHMKTDAKNVPPE